MCVCVCVCLYDSFLFDGIFPSIDKLAKNLTKHAKSKKKQKNSKSFQTSIVHELRKEICTKNMKTNT
jgi:hypothetical protein